MQHRKWIAAALAAVSLAWGSAAWAQVPVYDGQSFRQSLQGLAVSGIVRADSTGRILTVDASGNLLTSLANTAGSLSGLTFQQNNAIGPTSFRPTGSVGSNTITSSPLTVHKDSTIVLSTLGATRIGLFIYMQPDTAVDTLSLIHWFALGMRANVTAANDSGSAAPILALKASAAVAGVTAIAAESQNMANGAVAIVSTLLPGEILVPLVFAGNGQSGWKYFQLEQTGLAPFPDRVSFTLRYFGSWNVNPQAVFFRTTTQRVSVRMDVRGYR